MSERIPIETLQVGLGTFEGRVERARSLHDRGEAGFVDAYREAARVIDQTLLPAADALDKANHDVLEETYNSHAGQSIATVIFLLLMGAALLAALFAVQTFITRKTHRLLNPLLLVTTLATIGFIVYTFGALGTERHELKIAKEDAFTSIHALWQARAVAYSANADESRYLLDTAHADEHERNFHRKMSQLAAWPSGVSGESVLEAVKSGTTSRWVQGISGG